MCAHQSSKQFIATEARKVVREATRVIVSLGRGICEPQAVLGEHCAIFIHPIKHFASYPFTKNLRKDQADVFCGAAGRHFLIEVEPLEVGVCDVDWSKLCFYLTDGRLKENRHPEYHEVRFNNYGVAIALHLVSDLGYEVMLEKDSLGPNVKRGRK